MRFITRICWLGLMAITGIILSGFVTSNKELITIHLWPTQTIMQAEAWIFMLGTFILGIFTGATILWIQSLSLKARLWSKAKQLSELEARIEETEYQLDKKRSSSDYGQ